MRAAVKSIVLTICLVVQILIGCSACGRESRSAPGRLPYRDPKLTTDRRVEDLLARMTPEEKFRQLFMVAGDLDAGTDAYKDGIFGLQVRSAKDARGAAEKIDAMQKFFVEETRLGIPIVPFEEALHGLVAPGATAFPQAIGLAATWDTGLMADVSAAAAAETRSRGIRQVLSPVINIARDVRWGRTEETYGEDPFLASRMAVAFVRAFEERGVIATPKHFVANVGAGGRDSYPIPDGERFLREVDFPPFLAAIKEGGARSIMTAYNSWDGLPCSANPRLLGGILKGEWGFGGFVISDACSVGGSFSLHLTADSYPESGRQAWESGLDVVFQTEIGHAALFGSGHHRRKGRSEADRRRRAARPAGQNGAETVRRPLRRSGRGGAGERGPGASGAGQEIGAGFPGPAEKRRRNAAGPDERRSEVDRGHRAGRRGGAARRLQRTGRRQGLPPRRDPGADRGVGGGRPLRRRLRPEGRRRR